MQILNILNQRAISQVAKARRQQEKLERVRLRKERMAQAYGSHFSTEVLV